MLKNIQIIFTLLLCLRIVFSQRNWDFAVTTSDKIIFYDGNWSEVNSAAHQFDSLNALAFDDIGERLYFNDHGPGQYSIYALKIPLGNSRNHIIDDLILKNESEHITAMAYDPLSQDLFWIDKKNRKIYSSSVNVSKQLKLKVVLNFADDYSLPDGIAIDVCHRKLYWTNSNSSTASVECSDLDGANRKVLINTDLYEPRGITVDQHSDRIFYVVNQQGIHFTIESAKLDGTDRQVILSHVNNEPNSIAVSKDYVYWTDFTFDAIWKVSKDNSTKSTRSQVKLINNIRGLVARQKNMLLNLKLKEDCINIATQIENKIFPANVTNVRMEADRKHDMFCLNNGFYSESTESCLCNAGYSGNRCQTDQCYHYCINGSCSIVDGSAQCTCQQGYKGKRCETYNCTNYCLNGGECSIESEKTVCSCKVGFDGDRCERSTTTTCSPECTKMEVITPLPCNVTCDNNNNHQSYEITPTPQANIECRNSWNKSIIIVVAGGVGGLLLIYLIIQAIRRIYKPARPRIRKTFVVQKKMSQTPLTSRPIATEQCEITIENCCNMNICDTPCFDPQLLQQSMSQGSSKGDKDILIHNIEN